MPGTPVAGWSDTCLRRPTCYGQRFAVSYVQPPPGHASFHGPTTNSVIEAEASVLQALACGTVYHRTYNKTWTSRISRMLTENISILGVIQKAL